MSHYPEHEKLDKVNAQTQVIGDFLEWCAYEKGVQLGQHEGHQFYPFSSSEALMAEWAGIDREKLEAEKREMLAQLRAASER